jgi:phosphatidylserine decarboxylase
VSRDRVTFGDRAFIGLQHCLPKHLLTRVIYALARSKGSTIRNLILKIFLRGYRVNLSEAVEPDPFAYPSFNAFFTRALRKDARPIASDPDAIVSPVDGTVSQAGPIREDLLLQAKGHDYSLLELLAGDAEAANAYRNGSFTCIYLAPYNYHRIHMPIAGRARNSTYVPGALFSVNAATARALPGLFARNERLICEFDTALGRVAVILVGALFVGSIETVHLGEVNPPPRRQLAPIRLDVGNGREFARGDELGRFNMGSTVVLLFERERIRWDSALVPLATTVMGRTIGRATGGIA